MTPASYGPRRRSASRHVFRAGGVSAPGDPGARRRARPGLATSAPICRAVFSALKTWFTLKTYGTEKLGAVITRTCALAGYLEARILAEPRLELLAPVQLNIVCFRYRAADANKVNGEIVIDIQESGIAAPSTTLLDGQLAIRAAIARLYGASSPWPIRRSSSCWKAQHRARHDVYVVPGAVLPTPEGREYVALVVIDKSNKVAHMREKFRKLVKAWPRPVIDAPSGLRG